MPGYDEDIANSQVNESILEREFNLDTTEERAREIEKIREMRGELMLAVENAQDPDTILLANIDRANNLLDVAQRAIESGGETNARLFEVCAQLINAITSAAASVQNSSFGAMKHEYNMRMIEVKEKEIAVKAALAQEKAGGRKGSGGSQVVVMSREELLKMIDEEEKEVHVSSAAEEEK